MDAIWFHPWSLLQQQLVDTSPSRRACHWVQHADILRARRLQGGVWCSQPHHTWQSPGSFPVSTHGKTRVKPLLWRKSHGGDRWSSRPSIRPATRSETGLPCIAEFFHSSIIIHQLVISHNISWHQAGTPPSLKLGVCRWPTTVHIITIKYTGNVELPRREVSTIRPPASSAKVRAYMLSSPRHNRQEHTTSSDCGYSHVAMEAVCRLPRQPPCRGRQHAQRRQAPDLLCQDCCWTPERPSLLPPLCWPPPERKIHQLCSICITLVRSGALRFRPPRQALFGWLLPPPGQARDVPATRPPSLIPGSRGAAWCCAPFPPPNEGASKMGGPRTAKQGHCFARSIDICASWRCTRSWEAKTSLLRHLQGRPHGSTCWFGHTRPSQVLVNSLHNGIRPQKLELTSKWEMIGWAPAPCRLYYLYFTWYDLLFAKSAKLRANIGKSIGECDALFSSGDLAFIPEIVYNL